MMTKQEYDDEKEIIREGFTKYKGRGKEK